MDIVKFVKGLRALGIPNEQAVYIGYAVAAGAASDKLLRRIGTFGLERVFEAVRAVEKKAG